MIHKVFVDGQPYLLDDSDGTMLPPIMGGQWGTHTDPGYGAGTAPTVAASDVPPGVKLPLSLLPLGGGVGILVDGDGIPVVGDDNMPILRNMETGGTGTGSAAPQWRPGELDLEQQAAAAQERYQQGQLQAESDRLNADIAESEANLVWLREQLATQEAGLNTREAQRIQANIDLELKRIENSNRELVYTMGMQERGTLIQEKAATGRELMKVGPDQFRQAAILSGGVQRGITPQQTVVGQAQAFMNQPLPQVSMGMSLPQLEQSIASMQNQGMTQPTFGGFGMAAEGVTIEMEQKDGAFSMKPAKESYIIGEGKRGEGFAAGTAEILTVEKGPFGFKSVEVTSLAGAGQGGFNLTPQTLETLAPMYQGLGLGAIPTRTGYGATGETMTGNFGALSKLGITPRYVRDVLTGQIWRITGNTRQYITNPEAMAGINPADVVGATTSEIARLAPTVGTPLSTLPPPGAISPTGGYGAVGAPLVESVTGAILPAAHRRAGLLGQWSQERPDLFGNAMSAYGNVLDPWTGGPFGGVSPDVIQSQVGLAPKGRTWNPQRIGFTGTRY